MKKFYNGKRYAAVLTTIVLVTTMILLFFAGNASAVTGNGTGVEVTGNGTGVEVGGAGTGVEVTGNGTGTEVTGNGTGTEVTGNGTGTQVTGNGTGTEVGGAGTGTEYGPNGIDVCFTASWYDPDFPGEGFNTEVLRNQVVVYWYVTDGWYLLQGLNFDNLSIYQVWEGDLIDVGTAYIDFYGNDEGRFFYDFALRPGGDDPDVAIPWCLSDDCVDDIPLTRLTRPIRCGVIDPEVGGAGTGIDVGGAGTGTEVGGAGTGVEVTGNGTGIK